MPRNSFKTSTINATYYAKNNSPSFNQFGQYHFVDSQGRQYKIFADNGRIFQNKRFEKKPLAGHSAYTTCRVNKEGEVGLFVKLPSADIQWFSRQAIGTALRLYPVKQSQSKQIMSYNDGITVTLRKLFRGEVKRRTGTIYVSALDPGYCNRRLNSE